VSAIRVVTRHPDADRHRFEIAEALNRTIRGNLDASGTFTLTPSSTTTVVIDNLFAFDQMVVWSPRSATAATAMTSVYVSAKLNGQFTLTHNSDAATDRTFDYIRIG
jgi:hypothetical protein